MKLKYLAFLGILILLFNCTKRAKKVNEPLKLDYLTQLPNDTIQYNFEKNTHFNVNPDSLIGKILSEFTLKDTINNSVLIHWHLFQGIMLVKKLDDKKYEFTGMNIFYINGKYINHEEHIVLRYILEINENYYKVYRDKAIQLNLPYQESKIESLKKKIYNDTICMSKDWKLEEKCSNDISEYQYLLFSALLENRTKYKEEYVALLETFISLDVGEYAEDYEGSIMTLMTLGIVDTSDYKTLISDIPPIYRNDYYENYESSIMERSSK